MSLIEKAVEIFEGLPARRIDEYGFGTTHFAEKVKASPHTWRGFDFSPVAVENATKKGFGAHCQSVLQADMVRKSYVCAIALLPNLTKQDRNAFLERVKKAPHAVFGVKRHAMEKAVEYSSAREFCGFLRRWWPNVRAEDVGGFGIIAHCSHEKIKRRPILTVGTSTLLDFQGVLYTLASWQTHHGDFDGKIEFVVVDNHPEPTVRCKGVRGYFCPECKRIGKNGPVCSTCQKNLLTMKTIAEGEGARYIRWSDKQGTYPGKNQLKVEALGKWVLTMDSHVLLTPDTLETCLDLIEDDPECDDFFHFPCHLRSYDSAHPARPASMDHRKQQFIYHKVDRGGCYGWTGKANTPGKPYPIAAMITSCYLLRKAAWETAHGYDPILGNYGGWEGPLQLKWWLMGRKVKAIRYQKQEQIDRHGFLHHYHIFSNRNTKVCDNKTTHVHSGIAKQRNFAASSAVIGGERWVRRHCELKGWDFNSSQIQAGFKAGLELRPWMIENLGNPEWEDITKFFEWMKAEKIPGALETW